MSATGRPELPARFSGAGPIDNRLGRLQRGAGLSLLSGAHRPTCGRCRFGKPHPQAPCVISGHGPSIQPGAGQAGLRVPPGDQAAIQCDTYCSMSVPPRNSGRWWRIVRGLGRICLGAVAPLVPRVSVHQGLSHGWPYCWASLLPAGGFLSTDSCSVSQTNIGVKG